MVLCSVVLAATGCTSDEELAESDSASEDTDSTSADTGSDAEGTTSAASGAESATETGGGTTAATAETQSSETGEGEDSTGAVTPASCEEVAGLFVSLGSANPDLPDPFVQAECADGTVTVMSNSIPDFPYVQTTPGVPSEIEATYTFPATPTVAETPAPVPAIGAVAVAVNGLPIFGPTEGPGGDVLSGPDPENFTNCGGHNGPGAYHFHMFEVEGADRCRFSEGDGRVVFGYAFDGYPIYGGFDYTSSYELTDESLFGTDTWAAHTYVEGLGDLDECNGLTDENGNYGYYATETFPYIIGCFRGDVP